MVFGRNDGCGDTVITESGDTFMIDFKYSLIIEATEEPDFFGFFSPDLAGFSGVGHSIEDCIYKARYGMLEHVKLLQEQNLQVPPVNSNPTIIIRNEPVDKAA
jgi:predicted RNase H-like HicB family nuclease